MPQTPDATSSVDVRGLIESLVGQLVGDLANEMEARLITKFDRLEARLSNMEGHAKSQFSDTIINIQSAAERELNRGAKAIERVEGLRASAASRATRATLA